jgi:hypothetical protein
VEKSPITIVLLSEDYITKSILAALIGTMEGPVIQPAEVVIALSRPNQLHIDVGSCYKIIFQEKLMERIHKLVPTGILAALRPHFRMKESNMSVSISLYNFEPDEAIHTQCFVVSYPMKGNADKEVCKGVESFFRSLQIDYQMVKE